MTMQDDGQVAHLTLEIDLEKPEEINKSIKALDQFGDSLKNYNVVIKAFGTTLIDNTHAMKLQHESMERVYNAYKSHVPNIAMGTPTRKIDVKKGEVHTAFQFDTSEYQKRMREEARQEKNRIAQEERARAREESQRKAQEEKEKRNRIAQEERARAKEQQERSKRLSGFQTQRSRLEQGQSIMRETFEKQIFSPQVSADYATRTRSFAAHRLRGGLESGRRRREEDLQQALNKRREHEETISGFASEKKGIEEEKASLTTEMSTLETQYGKHGGRGGKKYLLAKGMSDGAEKTALEKEVREGRAEWKQKQKKVADIENRMLRLDDQIEGYRDAIKSVDDTISASSEDLKKINEDIISYNDSIIDDLEKIVGKDAVENIKATPQFQRFIKHGGKTDFISKMLQDSLGVQSDEKYRKSPEYLEEQGNRVAQEIYSGLAQRRRSGVSNQGRGNIADFVKSQLELSQYEDERSELQNTWHDLVARRDAGLTEGRRLEAEKKDIEANNAPTDNILTEIEKNENNIAKLDKELSQIGAKIGGIIRKQESTIQNMGQWSDVDAGVKRLIGKGTSAQDIVEQVTSNQKFQTAIKQGDYDKAREIAAQDADAQMRYARKGPIGRFMHDRLGIGRKREDGKRGIGDSIFKVGMGAIIATSIIGIAKWTKGIFDQSTLFGSLWGVGMKTFKHFADLITISMLPLLMPVLRFLIGPLREFVTKWTGKDVDNPLPFGPESINMGAVIGTSAIIAAMVGPKLVKWGGGKVFDRLFRRNRGLPSNITPNARNVNNNRGVFNRFLNRSNTTTNARTPGVFSRAFGQGSFARLLFNNAFGYSVPGSGLFNKFLNRSVPTVPKPTITNRPSVGINSRNTAFNTIMGRNPVTSQPVVPKPTITNRPSAGININRNTAFNAIMGRNAGRGSGGKMGFVFFPLMLAQMEAERMDLLAQSEGRENKAASTTANILGKSLDALNPMMTYLPKALKWAGVGDAASRGQDAAYKNFMESSEINDNVKVVADYILTERVNMKPVTWDEEALRAGFSKDLQQLQELMGIYLTDANPSNRISQLQGFDPRLIKTFEEAYNVNNNQISVDRNYLNRMMQDMENQYISDSSRAEMEGNIMPIPFNMPRQKDNTMIPSVMSKSEYFAPELGIGASEGPAWAIPGAEDNMMQEAMKRFGKQPVISFSDDFAPELGIGASEGPAWASPDAPNIQNVPGQNAPNMGEAMSDIFSNALGDAITSDNFLRQLKESLSPNIGQLNVSIYNVGQGSPNDTNSALRGIVGTEETSTSDLMGLGR